jgi:hypothetical protein
MNSIKSKVRDVVKAVFQLKEEDDTLHGVLNYMRFGGALALSKT